MQDRLSSCVLAKPMSPREPASMFQRPYPGYRATTGGYPGEPAILLAVPCDVLQKNCWVLTVRIKVRQLIDVPYVAWLLLD